MRCRCGGKYDKSLVANILMSPTVKKNLKSVKIYQSYERISSGTFLMAHGVDVNDRRAAYGTGRPDLADV